MQYDVEDLHLAEKGHQRIDWARQSMRVLELIRRRFALEKPLNGGRLAACLHVTTAGRLPRLLVRRNINRSSLDFSSSPGRR
jgi:adenosylhomocysteinase